MRLYAIRLKRVGRWNRPVYNVVVSFADSRIRGRAFEKIGFYSPASDPKMFFISIERLAFWLMRGAVPSYKIAILFGKLFSKSKRLTKVNNLKS